VIGPASSATAMIGRTTHADHRFSRRMRGAVTGQPIGSQSRWVPILTATGALFGKRGCVSPQPPNVNCGSTRAKKVMVSMLVFQALGD